MDPIRPKAAMPNASGRSKTALHRPEISSARAAIAAPANDAPANNASHADRACGSNVRRQGRKLSATLTVPGGSSATR